MPPIPLEIFRLIALHQVSTSNLRTLSSLFSTCKSLFHLLAPILYRRITISSDHQAKLVHDSIANKPYLGEHVKELQLLLNRRELQSRRSPGDVTSPFGVRRWIEEIANLFQIILDRSENLQKLTCEFEYLQIGEYSRLWVAIGSCRAVEELEIGGNIIHFNHLSQLPKSILSLSLPTLCDHTVKYLESKPDLKNLRRFSTYTAPSLANIQFILSSFPNLEILDLYYTSSDDSTESLDDSQVKDLSTEYINFKRLNLFRFKFGCVWYEMKAKSVWESTARLGNDWVEVKEIEIC